METLKSMREAIGFKQFEAADKLDISKDYLCMLENGKRQPNNKLIMKMSILYCASPENIF